jgi:hypothetical protein
LTREKMILLFLLLIHHYSFGNLEKDRVLSIYPAFTNFQEYWLNFLNIFNLLEMLLFEDPLTKHVASRQGISRLIGLWLLTTGAIDSNEICSPCFCLYSSGFRTLRKELRRSQKEKSAFKTQINFSHSYI